MCAPFLPAPATPSSKAAATGRWCDPIRSADSTGRKTSKRCTQPSARSLPPAMCPPRRPMPCAATAARSASAMRCAISSTASARGRRRSSRLCRRKPCRHAGHRRRHPARQAGSGPQARAAGTFDTARRFALPAARRAIGPALRERTPHLPSPRNRREGRWMEPGNLGTTIPSTLKDNPAEPLPAPHRAVPCVPKGEPPR